MLRERGSLMVILDAPYASDMLLDWLEESQHPVLANSFASSIPERRLRLVGEGDAIAAVNAGERIYANSENALAWVLERTSNESLKSTIRLFKDKAEMRRRLASLDAGLFFEERAFDELSSEDYARLPSTVVLKPSVGFCSMGVFVVSSQAEWDAALARIGREADRWQSMYPESVVGAQRFIVEGYLEGQEYAIDAFFDERGKAHVLNVLRHDFASAEDTSDRLYLAGARIFAEMAPRFEAWLDEVASIVGAKDFPVHAEVRVQDGRISPIEFNPLRFAGLGGTDVSQYAFGFRTYEAYLEDELPDPALYLDADPDVVVTMSLLNPPVGTDGSESFDYDAFVARFEDVCEMRRFDVRKVGCYGFLFVRTTADSPELAFLLHDDLRSFVRRD